MFGLGLGKKSNEEKNVERKKAEYIGYHKTSAEIAAQVYGNHNR